MMQLPVAKTKEIDVESNAMLRRFNPYKWVGLSVISAFFLCNVYWMLEDIHKTREITQYVTSAIQHEQPYDYAYNGRNFDTTDAEFHTYSSTTAADFLEDYLDTPIGELSPKERQKIQAALSFLAFSERYSDYYNHFSHVLTPNVESMDTNYLALTQEVDTLIARSKIHSKDYTQTKFHQVLAKWEPLKGDPELTVDLKNEMVRKITILRDLTF